MPALDLRRLNGVVVAAEGVKTSSDFLVAQRGAGANMSVDVAAGQCYVQDDHGAGGGYYHAVWNATDNVAIAAADPTNPRIDRVVVRVRDQFLGDATNAIDLFVVQGTPSAGATLVNCTGAGAVPGSCLLLANVLVPAASSSVITANIDTTGASNNSPLVRPVLTIAGSFPAAGAVTCEVYNSVAISIPNNANTTLTWDSEIVDASNMHSTVTNTSRLTCVVAGVYLVTASVWYVANGTGQRNIKIIKNAGATAPNLETRQAAWAGDWNVVQVTGLVVLALTDYIECQTFQTSGGALNTGSSQLGYFAAAKVG